MKRSFENKLCMVVYDNIKLQKKAQHLCKCLKDIEKTLGRLDHKKHN